MAIPTQQAWEGGRGYMSRSGCLGILQQISFLLSPPHHKLLWVSPQTQWVIWKLCPRELLTTPNDWPLLPRLFFASRGLAPWLRKGSCFVLSQTSQWMHYNNSHPQTRERSSPPCNLSLSIQRSDWEYELQWQVTQISFLLLPTSGMIVGKFHSLSVLQCPHLFSGTERMSQGYCERWINEVIDEALRTDTQLST